VLWPQISLTARTGEQIIQVHLRATLGDLGVSLPTVKRWLSSFREGDRYCEDRNRAGRPFTLLGDVLSKFFSKYPFGSAQNIASDFDVNASTAKNLLARELGLRKFTRRRAPHFLSELQKNEQVTQSRLLLDLLQRHQTADFNAIATGDELRFRCVYPTRTIYARSQSDVISCLRRGTGTLKVMITIF
jgi:transposase